MSRRILTGFALIALIIALSSIPAARTATAQGLSGTHQVGCGLYCAGDGICMGPALPSEGCKRYYMMKEGPPFPQEAFYTWCETVSCPVEESPSSPGISPK